MTRQRECGPPLLPLRRDLLGTEERAPPLGRDASVGVEKDCAAPPVIRHHVDHEDDLIRLEAELFDCPENAQSARTQLTASLDFFGGFGFFFSRFFGCSRIGTKMGPLRTNAGPEGGPDESSPSQQPEATPFCCCCCCCYW